MRLPRARRGEIGVGLVVADGLHGAADPHLPAQRLPVEAHRGLPGGEDLPALAALEIRVEDEALRVEALEQHHAHVGQAIRIDGRQRDAVRVVRLGEGGFLQPGAEKLQGLVGLGEVTSC